MIACRSTFFGIGEHAFLPQRISLLPTFGRNGDLGLRRTTIEPAESYTCSTFWHESVGRPSTAGNDTGVGAVQKANTHRSSRCSAGAPCLRRVASARRRRRREHSSDHAAKQAVPTKFRRILEGPASPPTTTTTSQRTAEHVADPTLGAAPPNRKMIGLRGRARLTARLLARHGDGQGTATTQATGSSRKRSPEREGEGES